MVKIVNYETKEFSSIYRSLIALEKHDIVQRVHVQLSWKLADKNSVGQIIKSDFLHISIFL